MFQACSKADISGLTGDFALDVIERADTIQRLAGDRRFRLAPFVVEITPQMCPAGCLAQAGRSVRVRVVELGIRAMVEFG